MSSESTDEPLFVQANDRSDDFVSSVHEARSTFPSFKTAFQNPKFKACYFLIKTKFVVGEATNGQALIWKSDQAFPINQVETAHIWLIVNDVLEDICFTSTFEVPSNFGNLNKGQSFVVCDDDIEDWMINDDGNLYGGYSIRLHRNALGESQRSTFDSHVGVTKYMEILP